MPAIYEHRHLVTADEIDGLGHVNNLRYLKWTQDAALAHSAAQGWPPEAYIELGAGFVVRAHRVEYLRSALADQELIVRTWISRFRRVTSLRRYDIIRAADGVLLARAATDWAFINLTSGMPCRVPPEISQAFEIVEDPAKFEV